jgi:hypothetical protein
MPAPKKLDTQTETQVVAMIARGDKYDIIVDWLKETHGINTTPQNLSVIKKRNSEALKFMQGEIIKHETTMATTILNKSRQLIDKRLNRAMKIDEELLDLRTKLENGEIEDGEYYDRVNLAMKSQLTVQELNSLSKESFNQSQIEAGKPTNITDNPTQAKANLQTLLSAISTNDQGAMLRAIFPDD